MNKFAVIVAAGAGSRMGTAQPKQFMHLLGKPVIWYTLQTFLKTIQDLEIILVLPEAHLKTGHSIIDTTIDPTRIRIVTGGNSRFHSVKQGLSLIKQPSIVFVHDGVRCLVSPLLIDRCLQAAELNGTAIPAIEAVDTIRLGTRDSNKQVERGKVFIIQTPQTFQSGLLIHAYQNEYSEYFTDDASVVEASGIKIHLIDGEPTNIKITRPIDITIAQKILEERGLE
ncbi:MAG TPA: 2-C-methyl-D-erythritol 4-phosphate cytidylyltransferase [Flavitalea sp.]|nr:2-C-methyl-D-erythritol 4-phosphate cytidylyltransferase [Flavitalea sp.]